MSSFFNLDLYAMSGVDDVIKSSRRVAGLCTWQCWLHWCQNSTTAGEDSAGFPFRYFTEIRADASA